MPRAQLARTRDAARIHPSASGDVVANALSRVAQPGEQRCTRSAVEIDREVVSSGAKLCAELQIGGDAAQAACAWSNDDVVEMRIMSDNRRRRRFDEIGQLRVRKAFSQRA